MGIFDGMRTAQVFAQPNYMKPGIYDVRIVRCLAHNTMRSGLGFIVELEILSSTHPDHPVGSKASWFQGMTRNQATAFSAIKEFVIALNGLDPSKDAEKIKVEIEPYIEQWLDAAVGTNNVFGGKLVHLETFMKKTRERNMDFTVHRWTPYSGTAQPTPPMPQPQQPPQYQAAPQQPQYQAPQQQYQAPPAAQFAPPVQQFAPQAAPQFAPPPVQQFAVQAQPQFAPPPQVAPPGYPQQVAPTPPKPVWDPASNSWRLPQ